MHRRRVLSLIGAVGLSMSVSMSGCLSSEPGDAESKEANASSPESVKNPAQTASHSPSSNSTADRTEQRRFQLSVGQTAYLSTGTVSVTDPTVQGSAFGTDEIRLFLMREPTQQFVVVEIKGTLEVSPAAFALRRDGQVPVPPSDPRYIAPVIRACSASCIGIPVETRPTDSAAIVYQPSESAGVRAAWSLDADTVRRLSVQPTCQLRKAQVTESDGNVALRLTVANVSPRDAGFRAVVRPAYVADVSEPIGFPVPEGQTVTQTVVPSEIQVYDPEEATFTRPVTEDTRFFTIGSE